VTTAKGIDTLQIIPINCMDAPNKQGGRDRPFRSAYNA